MEEDDQRGRSDTLLPAHAPRLFLERRQCPASLLSPMGHKPGMTHELSSLLICPRLVIKSSLILLMLILWKLFFDMCVTDFYLHYRILILKPLMHQNPKMFQETHQFDCATWNLAKTCQHFDDKSHRLQTDLGQFCSPLLKSPVIAIYDQNKLSTVQKLSGLVNSHYV